MGETRVANSANESAKGRWRRHPFSLSTIHPALTSKPVNRTVATAGMGYTGRLLNSIIRSSKNPVFETGSGLSKVAWRSEFYCADSRPEIGMVRITDPVSLSRPIRMRWLQALKL